MTPERWQQVKELLHGALQKDPGERSAFLGHACQADRSLQLEVESLLASASGVEEEFLKSLSFDSSDRAWLGKGERLGSYEVINLLGVGGMGEVYRAHDPRLGRDVAIKVLPRASISDPDRLHRFEQEARAAAALNHPNIVAIYDVGKTGDGTPYVVSELLEGATLRQSLGHGPFPARKTVDFALQLASGLAAAHNKEIVHRDLKPENVFLTSSGHVKILDFGLAKLMGGPLNAEAATLTGKTDAGTVLGTLGYMPPEQVRGLAIDQRADIFALGAILYEMLSDKKAFRADTNADTIEAILNRDPTPLRDINPSVPPGLDKLIQRCLDKNPNDRFHSVRDVAFALEAISDASAPLLSHEDGRSERRLAAGRRRYVVWGFAAAVLALLASIYFSYRARNRPPATKEWEQLTNFPDSAVFPTLSPDGRMLAFIRGPDTFVTDGDLYVKLLPQGEPVQLTHDQNVKATPAFSYDGSRIAYSVVPAWDTWIVQVLGGKPRLMLPNASGLTWIDDQHILFSEIKSGIHMAVVTAIEGRAQERDIYIPSQEDGMAHRSYLSPDHKSVLIAEEMDSQGVKSCRLVSFDGHATERLVGPAGHFCTYAGWSPDGNWMYFSAANWTSGFHLWRQRFPDGETEQLTFGPTEQEGVAVAPDGRSVLASVGLTTSTAWVHDKTGERQVPFEGSASVIGGQYSSRAIFSPDGKQLYLLGKHSPKDAEELWAVDLTSGLAERLMPGMSVARSFDISTDGKHVVFDSRDAKGEPHLWSAVLDRRSAPQQIQSDSPEMHPLFGARGEVVFQAIENGHSYICRRPLNGGPRVKVTQSPVNYLQTISPDGKWAVAETPLKGEELNRAVIAFGVDDGAVKRICQELCVARWSLDGKWLYIGLLGGGGHSDTYRTFVIPLRAGESFPRLPAAGIKTDKDLTGLVGVKVVNDLVRPGPNGSLYAFSRYVPRRNIYRIPVP
jgi:serine/threonine protein kinase/Tol biopolymer transport system component